MEILKVEDIGKIFKKDKDEYVAVDNVNLYVNKGECVGLVGESGCGKSTIAKMITGLEPVSSGNIFIEDKNVTNYNYKQKKELYKDVQMIFQNPVDSFNPRVRLGDAIGDIKVNFGHKKKDIKDDVLSLLEKVGLKEDYYDRYPREVSGGECQRAAIARSLVINPKLIICDEATSALDVSVQGQIINLLKDLQDNENLSYLFISHDLALVQNICQRIYVMYKGNIVEHGARNDVINNSKHPYTKLLLASNFSIEEGCNEDIFENIDMDEEEVFQGGCKFYGRCRDRKDICKNENPKLKLVDENHYVACSVLG